MALPELVSAEELFKGGVWDTLVDLGLAALFAEAPYLNIPILRDGIKWLIRKFTDAMFTFFQEFVNLKYVFLHNLGMQKKFTEHALALKGLAIEKGLDSKEYKDAREEHKKALAEKVRSLLVPAVSGMLARASAQCDRVRSCGRDPGWIDLRREQHWKNIRDGLRAGDRVA